MLCPWCYVAAVRIRRVEAEAGDALRVEWRSFMLRPQPEARSLEKFRRYARSWARPAAAEPDAAFNLWSSDAAPPSHSLPPLVATKVAASFGDDAFAKYHHALFRAYFVDNRTVSDSSVLREVAAGVGLDGAEFATRFERDNGEYAAAVVADHRAALAEGIAAVPSLMVDHEHVLTGALATDAYRRIVARRSG
ncbi:MAG TPA: DsbA family protein [Acidimicrobiia bacterium]|nr:DsbA family protein [Acidimicrobiia bacterium]